MNIDIQGLVKKYKGGFKALDDVSLEIKEGMFGLLGPNGAGKTTLISILATLLEPTEGKVLVNNFDIIKNRKEIRSFLGYLPQEFGVYPQLTAYEFLKYTAELNGLHNINSDVEKILHETNLFKVRDRKVSTFSGGMVRRVGIAQALIGSPKLLIVDEPTTGLDPEERIRFRNLLAELSGERIILLSTHIVGDISSTCEDIAILNHGKIVYRGDPYKLIEMAKGRTWIIEIPEKDIDEVKDNFSIISMVVKDDGLKLRVVGDKTNGFPAREVEPSMEDAYVYFMEILQETLVEEEAVK